MGNSEDSFRKRVAKSAKDSRNIPDSSAVWGGLCGGTLRAFASFSEEDRSYLVLSKRCPPQSIPIHGRRREIVEAVLNGTSCKAVSCEIGVAQSTVSTTLKQALSEMGFDCLPSRVPALLVLTAYAALNGRTPSQGVASELDHNGENLLVLSAPLPEAIFEKVLAPAEYDVVRLLIHGETHRSIASLRQRSTRTVANQLASAFQRLSISGRSELLQRAAAHQCSSQSGI